MKHKKLGGIKNTITAFLMIVFALICMCIYQQAHAVLNSPDVTHSAANYVQCAQGRSGPGCPQGQELPPVQGPTIAFCDLISGPDTGLGDGLGSGAIVTCWGYNLGSSQGSSTVAFVDNLSVERPAAHIYYWKNADGQLPSGPSNLYESHGMQEIAFSIPDSALSTGRIKVTVGGQVAVKHDTSTENPQGDVSFLVREGNIYHVKTNGNDSNDGSFANPWQTVAKADETAGSGSTLYIHDVVTGSHTTDVVIYLNESQADSTLESQFAYVGYPNARPEAIGARGFNNYIYNPSGPSKGVDGVVISKYSIFAADSDTDENDLPINKRPGSGTFGIYGSKDGRAVGNYITDEHPSDINGACPDNQQAAIVGNANGPNRIENWKVFGNMIENYGCAGTNRQHHTMYFTNRSDDTNLSLVSPEVGYNYLKNNRASGGLHYFDENIGGVTCGDFTTVFKFHNNVVIDQTGPGIANYAACPTTTTFEYYNNVVINSGFYDARNGLLTNNTAKLSNFQAVHIAQGVGADASTATLNFNNNTIIGWNDSDQTGTVDSCIGFTSSEGTITINWNDNICQTDKDKRFIQSNYQGTALESRISGGGNVWRTSATEPSLAVPPSWDSTKIIADPIITVTGSRISVGEGSPIINQSSTTLDYNIYGDARGISSNVGAK